MVDTLTAPAVPEERLITGEEFYALGDRVHGDLIAGRIVSIPLPGIEHGGIEATLTWALVDFVRRHGLGRVKSGEVGIYTKRDPDTVRGPDVAFFSTERAVQVQGIRGYSPIAPDLAVEVVSPNDTWFEVSDKLNEYFTVGVRTVWIVDPQRRKVHVYASADSWAVYGVGESVPGGEVLPGFELAVAEVFG